MDEKPGTKKKRTIQTIATRTTEEAQQGPVAELTGQSKRASSEQACDGKSEAMKVKVIEGGARKRPPDIRDHISRQLKAVYDDVLNQPVPGRFMDLLQELTIKSGKDGQ